MKKGGLVGFVLFLLLTTGGKIFAQSASVNATVSINSLEVEIISPLEVGFGQWFSLEVLVKNLGTESVNNTNLEINASQKLSIRGRKKVDLGDLAAKEEKLVTFQAKANTPGEYVIQTEATGEQSGQELKASDSTVISSTGALGAKLLLLRDFFTEGLPNFFT